MAASYVGAGTVGTAKGPSGAATCGLPAGVQAGDVLLLVAHTVRGTATGSVNFAFPDIFDQTTGRSANGSSTSESVSYTTRIYEPGDPTTYTITIAAAESANTGLQAYILGFRGVDVSSMVQAGSVSAQSATTAGVAGTSITPPATALHATDGGIAVIVHTAISANGATTTPGGWTAGIKTTSATFTAGITSESYVQNFAAGTASSTAPVLSGSTSVGRVGFQIAFFPAKASETGTGARVRDASSRGGPPAISPVVIGKPLATQSGDIMVAAGVQDNGGTAASLTAPDASWTLLTSVSSGLNAGGVGTLAVWAKVAGSSEPTTYTFQHDGANVADVTFGIVSFSAAAMPTVFLSANSTTASASPVAPSVAGAAAGQLLVIFGTGQSASATRSMTSPSGMTKWVDDRPTNSPGWVSLSMHTQPLTTTAATGTRTGSDVEQLTNTAAFTSRTDPWIAVSVVIPQAQDFSGSLALSGSGSLSFAGGSPVVKGSLALSGSGSTVFGGGGVAANGALALSGSGSLSLTGKSGGGASVTLSGTGTLAFPAALPAAKGALSLSGAGVLSLFSSGGAGTVSLSGSGTVSFGQAKATAAGLLARTGSGSLSLAQSAMSAAGLLARTGSGTLSLIQSRMSAQGVLNRSGYGELSLGMSAWTELLQGWDSAQAKWRPLYVRAWDSTLGVWKLVAARKRHNGTWT